MARRETNFDLTTDASALIENLTLEFLTSTQIETLVDSFRYQGFDPTVIINEFAAKAKLGARNAASDLRVILVVYLTRGTKIEKVKNKTTKTAVEQFDTLVKTYGIKSTAGGSASNYSAKDLTLARIASAFAEATTKINSKESIRIVGEKVEGLPKAYHWPGGASMIPKDGNYDELFAKWIIYASSFDKVIQPGRNDNDRQNNSKKFGDIMRGNAFITDKVRVEAYQKFKKESL